MATTSAKRVYSEESVFASATAVIGLTDQCNGRKVWTGWKEGFAVAGEGVGEEGGISKDQGRGHDLRQLRRLE